jgi:hypothetical protein
LYVNDQLFLFLLERIQTYISNGILSDMERNMITVKEATELIAIARMRMEVPKLCDALQRDALRCNQLLEEDEEDMSELNQVILYANAGEMIPQEIVEAALKDFNKSGSIATVKDGTIKMLKTSEEVPLEAVMEALENCRAQHVFITLYKNTTADNDMQPFVVIPDKLIGFLQGSTACIPDLVKKINKMHAAADTFSEFTQDLFNSPNVITGLMNGDNCLVLLPYEGEVLEFDKGNVAKEADWGTTYAAAEPDGGGTPTEVKPGDEHKSGGGFGNFGKPSTELPKEDKEENKAIQRPYGASIAKIKPGDKSKIKSAELLSRISGDGTLAFKNNKEPHIQCPSGLHKNEATQWYEEHLGWLPMNWKTDSNKPNPIIPVSFLLPATPKVDLGTIKETASVPIVGKDVGTKHITPKMDPDKSTLDDFTNVLLPRIYGSNTEQITNPVELYKEEAKYKSIAELVNRDPKELRMPHIGRYQVAVENPLIASRLWGDEQLRSITKDVRISELEENIRKLEEQLVEAASKAKPSSSLSSFGKK